MSYQIEHRTSLFNNTIRRYIGTRKRGKAWRIDAWAFCLAF
jgi:hypothetical protein